MGATKDDLRPDLDAVYDTLPDDPSSVHYVEHKWDACYASEMGEMYWYTSVTRCLVDTNLKYIVNTQGFNRFGDNVIDELDVQNEVNYVDNYDEIEDGVIYKSEDADAYMLASQI